LLKDQSEEQTIVTIRAGKLTEEIVRGLATWASSSRIEGDRLTLSSSSNTALPEVVRYLVGKGADIYEIVPQRLTLEERFLQIVGSDGGM
jgi:hypothetical protein